MPTESQSIFASLTPNDWGIIFTMLGVAFAAVLAGIGSAIGVGKAGQAAAGVVAEQPDRFGNCMVLQLLPGSQGIYGFAVAILILIFSGVLGGDTSALTLEKGLSYFAASLPIAFGGLLSALHQAKVAVSGIHHNELENEKLIELAAHAECASSHPISKSLQRAYGKPIDRSRVSDIEEISGHGLTATVDGMKIAIGNDKLMEKLGVDCIPCHCVGTILHIAIDGKYAGHIVISDIEKPDARAAIAALKRTGVQKTVMLTGDTKRVAEQVAKNLGVDEVHSELLPADKVTQVEKLLAEKSPKAKLAFVGDGINDAPVLSRADIGIAMGAMGSDAAIEAADVVLMDDDPMKISKAIGISRKCIRIVYENIVFALVVKAACLILGACGIADMWLAIFADVGVMILAVLNAIRALAVKNV